VIKRGTASSSCSGLAEQIERDPIRIGGAVGQHQDLAGSGDHVDADLAEDQPFGGGDELVARPTILSTRGSPAP